MPPCSTSVGVIPDQWSAAPLDSLAKRGSGHTPDKNRLEYWGGSIKWVSLKDSDALDNVYIEETAATITPAGIANSSAVVHPAGTVVLSRDAGVGKAAIVKSAMAVSQHFMAWHCGARLDNHFLYYWLQSRKTEFERIAIGSTIKTIGLPYFRALELPLPPLSEQRAIATSLGDVDELIRALDRLIAKKRDLKRAATQQLLTGQTRLPGFSGKWEVKQLGNLFSFSGGVAASREQLSDSGICYLHYGDIHKSPKSFINVEADFIDIPRLDVLPAAVRDSAWLRDGDVVFVDASEDTEGTSKHLVVENPGQVPYIAGLHTIVAKSRFAALDNRYKRYCFQTQDVKEQFRFYAAGTKVSGISKTSIARILLTYPPSLPEQRAIAIVLSDMDAEIAVLEQRLAKTRSLKQGMMQELLTGKTRLV